MFQNPCCPLPSLLPYVATFCQALFEFLFGACFRCSPLR
nr:MAG TPA_asm: hypothetical protein [Bacteriophage sp.]